MQKTGIIIVCAGSKRGMHKLAGDKYLRNNYLSGSVEEIRKKMKVTLGKKYKVTEGTMILHISVS